MRAGQNAFSARRSITIESLPPGEEQDGPLELGRDLADDVDRLGLEHVEVGELGRHGPKPYWFVGNRASGGKPGRQS